MIADTHRHCRIARVRLKAAPHLVVHVPDFQHDQPDFWHELHCFLDDLHHGRLGQPESGSLVLRVADKPLPFIFAWGQDDPFVTVGELLVGANTITSMMLKTAEQ